MKILALVTDAFGGRGGISEYNRSLLKALAGSNINARIVVLPRLVEAYNEVRPEGVVQKGATHNKLLYSFRALWTAIFEGPFDVVFCGHMFMSRLGFFVSRVARASFWLQAHGREAFECPSGGVKLSSCKADLITCVSRYTRDKLLAWAAIDKDKVKVLHDTIDLERFKPGPKPENLLKRYGLQGKKILLSLGRITSDAQYKGIDRIINVLPDILEQVPDLAYVVAGKKGDDLPRLQGLAREKGVEDKVHFIGTVTDEELPEIYRMSDCFALPSNKEGFGIVFIEAAATGLPVLGGNSDGSKDALMDGKIGIMVDVENREELLRGMKDLLNREKKIPKELEEFSFPNFSQKLKTVLEDFLSCGDIRYYRGA